MYTHWTTCCIDNMSIHVHHSNIRMLHTYIVHVYTLYVYCTCMYSYSIILCTVCSLEWFVISSPQRGERARHTPAHTSCVVMRKERLSWHSLSQSDLRDSGHTAGPTCCLSPVAERERERERDAKAWLMPCYIVSVACAHQTQSP